MNTKLTESQKVVIPVKTGIQRIITIWKYWIPACAGMTNISFSNFLRIQQNWNGGRLEYRNNGKGTFNLRPNEVLPFIFPVSPNVPW